MAYLLPVWFSRFLPEVVVLTTEETRATGDASDQRAPASVLTCTNCGAKNRIRPNAKGVPTCGRCSQALPWLVNATDASFDTEADASTPVIVDLWAPWCGPCRFVGPILEDLSREYRGKLKVVKVNVDENPQTAQRYQAFSIPTMVILRGGQPVDRIVGALPKEQLVSRLSPHLAAA
jgi:thioredoxin 2